jgi:hypothetical protein
VRNVGRAGPDMRQHAVPRMRSCRSDRQQAAAAARLQEHGDDRVCNGVPDGAPLPLQHRDRGRQRRLRLVGQRQAVRNAQRLPCPAALLAAAAAAAAGRLPLHAAQIGRHALHALEQHLQRQAHLRPTIAPIWLFCTQRTCSILC